MVECGTDNSVTEVRFFLSAPGADEKQIEAATGGTPERVTKPQCAARALGDLIPGLYV